MNLFLSKNDLIRVRNCKFHKLGQLFTFISYYFTCKIAFCQICYWAYIHEALMLRLVYLSIYNFVFINIISFIAYERINIKFFKNKFHQFLIVFSLIYICREPRNGDKQFVPVTRVTHLQNL